MPPTHDNVLGVLSFVLYALILIISIKYIVVVMRADNQGEGGILTLTALIPGRDGAREGTRASPSAVRFSSRSASSARRCSTAKA